MRLRSLVNRLLSTSRSQRPVKNPSETTSEPPHGVYSTSVRGEPLRQCEILTGVIQRRRSFRSLVLEPELEEINHPYSIVVNQDCDLEQDFKWALDSEGQAKSGTRPTPCVLLLEALIRDSMLDTAPDKHIRRRVKQNQDERYHCLEEIPAPCDAEGAGVPALAVDFKKFFTVPTDELYYEIQSRTKRRARLNSPYLENFSRRFANFLSRVALPAEEQVDS